jgi:primosomal protein N''
MKDLNYVVGRLHGLNELVEILKDLADKKENQNSEMIAVLADHIAEQLQAIIRDFDKMDVEPEQRELLSDLKEKHMQPQEKGKKKGEEEEEDNREKLEKHERTVDDLLRDLESLKS